MQGILVILVITFATITFMALTPALRLKWFTAPLYARFKKVLPRLSETEQQALNAGTVGWDGQLFSGNPDWQQLHATSSSKLSREEQAFIDGPVNHLCQMIDDWQVTHKDHDLPPEAWSYIRKEGFFGMILPSEWGGLEFSNRAHSEVVMKLATHSITAAVTVMVPNSLGPGKLLLHYGTDAQKKKWLPKLANGTDIPCFALTGPQAGSDAGSLPDTGVVCFEKHQGKETLGLRLNWEKRYITLGPVATLIGLAFRCLDPDHLLGEKEDLGITVALIPRDTNGVEIGERHVPLNIPFMNGPNRGTDVFIPLDNIIGGREGIGMGWTMLVESLSEGRGISLPALSTGAGKAASCFTGAYAAIRRQFNQPIGRFEGIEEPLARIAGLTYQMDAARRLTLDYLDQGEKPSVISAIIKYHLTEKYRTVINDAMDIQGGSGICLGPSNLIGRVYQAIPIAITVEGANILTRSMIIFGQGAIRCHPWVLKEFNAVHNSDESQGVIDFDKALLGHASFLLGNTARVFVRSMTSGRSARVPSSRVERYYQTLSWMSTALALSADVAMMTLGGSLKRRERLSARLGDVLSELYLSSSVLRQYREHGETTEEYPLVRWTLQESLYRMQESFRSLYRNMPNRPLAWLLRLLTFPRGYLFSEPSDKAAHEAAAVLLKPSRVREQLIKGVFIHPDSSHKTSLLERTFRLADDVSRIERRLKQLRREGKLDSRLLDAQISEASANGMLSSQEQQIYRDYLELSAEVVRVDAFRDYAQSDQDHHHSHLLAGGAA